MSKNILELCLSPDLGGLELFALNYFNFLQKDYPNNFFATEKNSKIDLRLESKKKLYLKRNKFFPLIPALKLAKFIDHYKIDIIHFHWTKDIATAVLAKTFSKRKPRLIQSRHMHMTRFKTDFYHRWLYKNIDTIHAVTIKVQDQLKKFIPHDIRPKIITIYPGTQVSQPDLQIVSDLQKKYNITNNDFLIGIIGRIESAKGQHIVVEAIKKLNNKNFKLLIVGHAMDTHYLSNLHNYIKKNNLENQVVFTNFTPYVQEHLKLLDIHILATENETFGLVVIESMGNKICTIATNKGGPTEIIEHGSNGLLFDGTSSDLAVKIQSLYSDSKLKSSLASNGYDTVLHKFNLLKQYEKLTNLIKE